MKNIKEEEVIKEEVLMEKDSAKGGCGGLTAHMLRMHRRIVMLSLPHLHSEGLLDGQGGVVPSAALERERERMNE